MIAAFNYILVFRAPYLLVFTESALEVFDVNSAQWVQTVSLKKVNFTSGIAVYVHLHCIKHVHVHYSRVHRQQAV